MQNNTISPAQKQFVNAFVALNVNAADFAGVMYDKYEEYYNAEENGEDSYNYEDVRLFDTLLSKHNTPIRNFIDEVVKARQDIMSSDRECAAFIAAMRHYVDNAPKGETTPALVAVPDSLLEEYTKAGCTFGRVKDTKYIQVVRVASVWGDITFLYKGIY